MRIYYDTEFIEHLVQVQPDGRQIHVIEIISIGMVRQDGAEHLAHHHI